MFRVPTKAEKQVTTAQRTLQEYLDRLVEDRVDAPTDNLLGRSASRVAAGELTTAEAGTLARLVLVAGHETTSTMVGLGVLILLRHPEQAALVRDGDEATVRTVVEELLRLSTVVHARRRACTEDMEIGGTLIRSGEGVIFAFEQGNRDPAKYPHPDELDLSRGASQHLTFGFGIHQCLGQSLAGLSCRSRTRPSCGFPDLRVAVPDSQIRFRHNMTMYGVHELPVAF